MASHQAPPQDEPDSLRSRHPLIRLKVAANRTYARGSKEDRVLIDRHALRSNFANFILEAANESCCYGTNGKAQKCQCMYTLTHTTLQFALYFHLPVIFLLIQVSWEERNHYFQQISNISTTQEYSTRH